MEGLVELEALERVDENKAWLKCRIALARVRQAFYSRSGKMNPNARETVVLLQKVLRHGLMNGRKRRQTVDPRSRFSTRDCGPIRDAYRIILE